MDYLLTENESISLQDLSKEIAAPLYHYIAERKTTDESFQYRILKKTIEATKSYADDRHVIMPYYLKNNQDVVKAQMLPQPTINLVVEDILYGFTTDKALIFNRVDKEKDAYIWYITEDNIFLLVEFQ